MKSLHTQIMEIANKQPQLSAEQIKQIDDLFDESIVGALNYDAIFIPTDDCRSFPYSIKGYVISDKNKRFDDGIVIRISQTISRRIVNADISLITTKNSVYLMINPNETTQG